MVEVFKGLFFILDDFKFKMELVFCKLILLSVEELEVNNCLYLVKLCVVRKIYK